MVLKACLGADSRLANTDACREWTGKPAHDAPAIAAIAVACREWLAEEFDRRAGIGAARVRVANVGGEEFKEAVGRPRVGGGDQCRGAVGDGDELVHGC